MNFVGKDEANSHRVSKNQKKKHVKQMTQDEIAFIKKVVFRALNEHNNKIKVSPHVLDKMMEYRTDYEINAVRAMLEHLDKHLIEYSHKTKNAVNVYKRRILIRSTEEFEVMLDHKVQPCHLCVVLDIDKCEIITTYWCKAQWQHPNLRMKRYNKNLKIISNTFKRGKRGSKNRNKKNKSFRKNT